MSGTPIEAVPCRIEPDRPLAPLSTWRVGGPAAFYAEPATPAELAYCYEFASGRRIPLLALGGASNLLIHDHGFPGLVIRYMDREEIPTVDGKGLGLRVGARTLFSRLARQLGREGWSGLEWAEGIPGTIGGAVVGNAGAYGGEIADAVLEVEVFEPRLRTTSHFSAGRCEFAYRSSYFKRVGVEEAFVTAAHLRLSAGSSEEILARMDAIRTRRKAVSPSGLSCGSVFKNPPGDFAGRVVESLGLKGSRIGGAEISAQHANYIVNRDNATAEDVYRLIQATREKAHQELGLELELEVRLVGFQ